MEQIIRLLCFTLCAYVVACKSIHGEKTWRLDNSDKTVTINLSNRQNVQSYANFQTFESGIYYHTNFIEKQLYNFMNDFFSNIQEFPRIPQNVFPYYFIIPKFSNRNNGFHTVPDNLFRTPAISTSTKTPNKVEILTASTPKSSANRRLQGEIIPTLRSRTIGSQNTTTPPPQTIANTESPKTTTAEPQDASTALAENDEKGQFFDDEDDTTRPIFLRDIKSPKNDRKLDKRLRKMPEVEHGSVQAGI